MNRKISVIIPVVEDNTYLVRCINSLHQQTVVPAEIIIAECNVEIKSFYTDNVFCLSNDDTLMPVTTNIELEYTQNEFFEKLFDEERRIALNVRKAISLANSDYIYFCNVTSTLSPNVLESLCDNNTDETFGMANICYLSKNICIDIDPSELLWGKIFQKKALEDNPLPRWNYLEILHWIDKAQNDFNNKVLIKESTVFEASYSEAIQKVYTVKLKDDLNKYRKHFVIRIGKGMDLFEHINTYDYVKVNIVASLIEVYKEDYETLLDLTSKYVVFVFENRMNAKKNRKEMLREALVVFFEAIENTAYFEKLLQLFNLDTESYKSWQI